MEAWVGQKNCKKCEKSLPLERFLFFLDKKMNKYYPRSYCKTCSGRIANARRKRNSPEKVKERLRKYYHRHKDVMNRQNTENKRKRKLALPTNKPHSV